MHIHYIDNKPLWHVPQLVRLSLHTIFCTHIKRENLFLDLFCGRIYDIVKCLSSGKHQQNAVIGMVHWPDGKCGGMAV